MALNDFPIYYTHVRISKRNKTVHLAYKYRITEPFVSIMCDVRQNPHQRKMPYNRVLTCILCLYARYRMERAGHYGQMVYP